jgi:hypothetical protein
MHNNDSNVVWRGDGLARRRRAALELSVPPGGGGASDSEHIDHRDT